MDLMLLNLLKEKLHFGSIKKNLCNGLIIATNGYTSYQLPHQREPNQQRVVKQMHNQVELPEEMQAKDLIWQS
jgi:hypothetical protein